MQGTPYSTYDADSAADWAQIQSICSVSYPTTVPTPISTDTSILPGYAPNVTYTATCLSGNTYTAVSGDNVQTIAQKNNVATGTLLAINQLLPDGSDLQGGQVLCLPFTCQAHTVVANDTCSQLATAAGIALQSFFGYNPTINVYCTNLILGQNVCVSPPGGLYNATTIVGSIPTQTAIYATTTVAAPGPTAHGTTANCGKYYQVQTGDFCQVVAVNQTISLPLFEAINPDIDLKCDNLVPGLWYCVSPIQYWNQTGTPTTPSEIPAPTTTPDGSTDDCYQWYVVQPNDNCALIESSFGITFTQLQMWNPNLNSTCGNLLLGEAYCVDSPETTSQPVDTNTVTAAPTSSSSSAPTSVTAAVTTSTTVPAPTTTVTGTTSNCYKWYVVASGDTCDKIDTANGITFAQFQLWNTSVNSGCTNIQLGVAYCVSSPITASKKAKRGDGGEDDEEEEEVGVGGWPIVKPVLKAGLPPKFPGLSSAYDKLAHQEL
jgi:LysM repeat protein